MSISQGLLAEFDHEVANTRKTLERVPDDKMGWTPHSKSFPMGTLALHRRATSRLDDDDDHHGRTGCRQSARLSAARREQTKRRCWICSTKNVAEGREALAGVSDETLDEAMDPDRPRE